MPSAYISGVLSIKVELDDDNNFVFKEWTDKKLKKERDAYKKPSVGLWFEIENEKDPISPFAIPLTNLDVYEGALSSSQSKREFVFSFNGKAKVNIHRDTKPQIDAGKRPKLKGVSINGQSFDLLSPVDTDLVIQTKKL